MEQAWGDKTYKSVISVNVWEHHILRKLEIQSLKALRQTCRRFYMLVNKATKIVIADSSWLWVIMSRRFVKRKAFKQPELDAQQGRDPIEDTDISIPWPYMFEFCKDNISTYIFNLTALRVPNTFLQQMFLVAPTSNTHGFSTLVEDMVLATFGPYRRIMFPNVNSRSSNIYLVLDSNKRQRLSCTEYKDTNIGALEREWYKLYCRFMLHSPDLHKAILKEDKIEWEIPDVERSVEYHVTSKRLKDMRSLKLTVLTRNDVKSLLGKPAVDLFSIMFKKAQNIVEESLFSTMPNLKDLTIPFIPSTNLMKSIPQSLERIQIVNVSIEYLHIHELLKASPNKRVVWCSSTVEMDFLSSANAVTFIMSHGVVQLINEWQEILKEAVLSIEDRSERRHCVNNMYGRGYYFEGIRVRCMLYSELIMRKQISEKSVDFVEFLLHEGEADPLSKCISPEANSAQRDNTSCSMSGPFILCNFPESLILIIFASIMSGQNKDNTYFMNQLKVLDRLLSIYTPIYDCSLIDLVSLDKLREAYSATAENSDEICDSEEEDSEQQMSNEVFINIWNIAITMGLWVLLELLIYKSPFPFTFVSESSKSMLTDAINSSHYFQKCVETHLEKPLHEQHVAFSGKQRERIQSSKRVVERYVKNTL